MYEIPQELQYSEKIVFGLTLKQTFVVLSTGVLVYFTIFKWLISPWIKYSLALLIVVLGVLFTFFKLDQLISNFLLWIWSKRIKFFQSQSLFGVQKFENDFMFVKGVRTVVLEVFPMNYGIKNNTEQESIVKIFRKLLQSIDYPTQYFMRTEPLEIKKYLEVLGNKVSEVSAKTQNKIYEEQFAGLEKHLNQTISENNLCNRKFYIIIPELAGLEIQVKIVEDKIKNLGLKSKRLIGKELEKLIKEFINQENKELKNCKNHLEIGKTFHRVITAVGYPRIVEAGFLDKIITLQGNFDLSIHIQPKQISKTIVDLNRDLQKQRSDLYSEQLKNIINPSLEIKYEDTRRILEELQKGKDKLFDVSLYINCRANKLDELNLLTRKVEAELNSTLIIPEVQNFKQLQGLKSVAPTSKNILKVNRNITTTALSAFFPFTSKFLEIDNSGVWFGLNKNNIPIIIDPFKLSNPNGVILATSGAGKSYLAKLLISRQLLTGSQVIIIDPQGEYTDLVQKFNGQIIDLHTKSKTIINPLDLMNKTYEDKRLFLMDLIKVIFGEISPHQKSIIDKAISLAYTKKGITDDPNTWNKEPPKLEDVLQEIVKMKAKASEVTEYGIAALENKLELYVNGVFKFLNQHTQLKLNNQLICFNIQKLPNQVQPVMMFLILDFVYTTMQKELNRKILLIDESWKLLSRTEDAGYVFAIVKTCRKFNMGLLLINQEVEGLLESSAGKSVLANSSYTILLKQKPSVIKQLKTTFDLSDYERDYLLTANVGEGILITDQEHNELKIIASKAEHDLITTNADEKLQQKNNKVEKNEDNKPKEEKPVKKTELDFTKIAYDKEILSKEQIELLKNKGYQEFSEKIFSTTKAYFVKSQNSEEITCLFNLCTITDYLRSKSFSAKIVKKNKKFFLEVEKCQKTH
ncbi:ATP-binding protein [Candidatus Woesearchaeota archaeon]|nr:ATP-binding protein [Candidatus Woesearchaeota archaeon]